MELFRACIEQGWDIFPVKDKRPTVKWKSGACRTWEAWPEGCDVGVATGARSGIVVIDDDREKHGFSAWDPPTPTARVETRSGGWHYYYRHPGGRVSNSAGKIAEHVDVRGDGGYVVSYGIPEGAIEVLPEGLVTVHHGKIQPFYIAPQYRAGLEEAVINGRAFGGEGNRNNTLFRLACWFVENQMDTAVLRKGALDAGLTPDEIDRCLSGVMGRMVQ